MGLADELGERARAHARGERLMVRRRGLSRFLLRLGKQIVSRHGMNVAAEGAAVSIDSPGE